MAVPSGPNDGIFLSTPACSQLLIFQLLPEPRVPGTQVLNVHSAEYSQHLHNLPEAGTLSWATACVATPSSVYLLRAVRMPSKQDYPFVLAFVLLEQADSRAVPYRS